jgi:hypothetical protein
MSDLGLTCRFTGGVLTASIIAQRLVVLQTYNLIRDVRNGVLGNVEYIMQHGCLGYFEMTPDEAVDEWHKNEEQFYAMYQTGPTPVELAEDDPLAGRC